MAPLYGADHKSLFSRPGNATLSSMAGNRSWRTNGTNGTEQNRTISKKQEHAQLKSWASFLGNDRSITGANGKERFQKVGTQLALLSSLRYSINI